MGLVWVHFQASRRYLLMTSEAWSPQLCFREASHLFALELSLYKPSVRGSSLVSKFSGIVFVAFLLKRDDPSISNSLWKQETLHILDISGSVSLKFRGYIGGSGHQPRTCFQPWLHKQRYREHSCQSQCQSCSLIGLFQLGLTRIYNPLSNLGPWSNRLNFLLNIIYWYGTNVLPNKFKSWPLAKWDIIICKSLNFL